LGIGEKTTVSKTFQGRTAEPRDAKNYYDWLLAASDKNLVETSVYSEPTTNTIVVEADGEPVLMNSFRLVLCMEALAPKPGVDPKDAARALRELYADIRRVAEATGIKEVLFQCVDPTLEKFILRKGFTKVTTPIFKMKVGGDTDPLNHRRPEGVAIKEAAKCE
jgi:hypothetical protein